MTPSASPPPLLSLVGAAAATDASRPSRSVRWRDGRPTRGRHRLQRQLPDPGQRDSGGQPRELEPRMTEPDSDRSIGKSPVAGRATQNGHKKPPSSGGPDTRANTDAGLAARRGDAPARRHLRNRPGRRPPRRPERQVRGPAIPRKEEPVLARFWLTPTARFGRTAPAARRAHSSRAIVATSPKPTSATATYRSSAVPAGNEGGAPLTGNGLGRARSGCLASVLGCTSRAFTDRTPPSCNCQTTESHVRGQRRCDLASVLDACCSRTNDGVASSFCDDATRDRGPGTRTPWTRCTDAVASTARRQASRNVPP